MLAYLPDADVDAILSRGMPPRAARTITDPLWFKTQLWEVRQRGFAIDDEEFVDGVRCVAAPIFDLTGRQVGAISLLAPAMRVDMAHLLRLAGPVVEAARSLSRQLGYRAGDAGWAVAGGGQ